MRHTGEQIFTNTDTRDTAKVFNANILNKMSVPLHRPLDKAEFGDVFIEANALNVTNYYNEIVEVVDLSNPDLIKTLLVSEVIYDEFLNYNKTFEQSGSFNTLIDVNTNNIKQLTINDTFDATTNQDATSIPAITLLFDSNILAEITYNSLIESYLNNIPLRTTLTDNTSYLNTFMIYYDHLFYDYVTKTIDIYLDSTNNLSTLNDTTNHEIVSVTINSFSIKNVLVIDPYIELPKHHHSMDDLSNLEVNTNELNGYIKLIDNNVKLEFPQNLQIDRFKLNDSYFEKDQKDNLLKQTQFDIKMTNQLLQDELDYDSNMIDLGGDSTVQEYTFNSLNLITTELVELSTNDNQEINRTQQFQLSDTTEHTNSYLVEFLKFDFNLLISPSTSGVSDILNVFYQQVDKATINASTMPIYDYTDGTVTTINAYYDIQIVQPNINAVPFTIINSYKLYKDDDGYIQISIPLEYKDIIGTKHTTVKKDSDFYITFDSTDIPTNIELLRLDIISHLQESVNTYSISDNNKRFKIDRGRYKFVASNVLNKYTLKLFNNS